jgi:hypothetical protein
MESMEWSGVGVGMKLEILNFSETIVKLLKQLIV